MGPQWGGASGGLRAGAAGSAPPTGCPSVPQRAGPVAGRSRAPWLLPHTGAIPAHQGHSLTWAPFPHTGAVPSRQAVPAALPSAAPSCGARRSTPPLPCAPAAGPRGRRAGRGAGCSLQPARALQEKQNCCTGDRRLSVPPPETKESLSSRGAHNHFSW